MKRNLDEPNEEEQWCAARRSQVVAHLKSERAKHVEIGEWPAWHIAPIVSLWALNATTAPERGGAWAICGDVPTDTITSDAPKSPRAAVRAFAKRWHDAAAQMVTGDSAQKSEPIKKDRVHELALFLEVRSRQLIDWANDDSLWDVDDL
jgi:Domain of unknown function (DUF4826)